MSTHNIVAFPGLCTDERIFRDLAPEHVVAYGSHTEGDSLADYAQRLSFNVPIQPDTIFIGFDFGGLLALELARIPKFRENLSGVVLLSSVTQNEQVSGDLRRAANEVALLPNFLLAILLKSQCNTLARREGLASEDVRLVEDMASEVSLGFFRWAVQAGREYELPNVSQVLPGLPVLRVNGSEDRLLKVTPASTDFIVRGAGHFAPLSHAEDIKLTLDVWSRKLPRVA